jgi:P-type conjugative transfer protein TrbJ
MRTKFFMLCVSLMLFAGEMSAQWTVWDPSNFTQSIVNTSKQIVQTSTTAQNMVNNFKEVQKVYNQGKQYYDALKAVNGLVKDAKKVQKTILMVGEISDIYVHSFQKMLSDPNYSVEELNAIANGYTRLLEQSNDVLHELRGVINISTLSLSDKDRIDVVNSCYDSMVDYRNLVRYYTNKNIGVSYLRAKKQGETARVNALYGNPSERYW